MFISFYAFNLSFRTITFANILTKTFDAHEKGKAVRTVRINKSIFTDRSIYG